MRPDGATVYIMDDREEAFSSLRIRQHAALRRSTYRSRSHAIIAAGLCFVGAIQLGWFFILDMRAHGWSLRLIAYALAITAFCCGTIYFIGRARKWHRETKQVPLPEPTTPPDFSTLSDGSDLVDKLNRIE